MVEAIAARIHCLKTNKEESIKIMSKYTRGGDRAILEGSLSIQPALYRGYLSHLGSVEEYSRGAIVMESQSD
jgi:hypothetical protein